MSQRRRFTDHKRRNRKRLRDFQGRVFAKRREIREHTGDKRFDRAERAGRFLTLGVIFGKEDAA